MSLMNNLLNCAIAFAPLIRARDAQAVARRVQAIPAKPKRAARRHPVPALHLRDPILRQLQVDGRVQADHRPMLKLVGELLPQREAEDALVVVATRSLVADGEAGAILPTLPTRLNCRTRF